MTVKRSLLVLLLILGFCTVAPVLVFAQEPDLNDIPQFADEVQAAAPVQAVAQPQVAPAPEATPVVEAQPKVIEQPKATEPAKKAATVSKPTVTKKEEKATATSSSFTDKFKAMFSKSKSDAIAKNNTPKTQAPRVVVSAPASSSSAPESSFGKKLKKFFSEPYKVEDMEVNGFTHAENAKKDKTQSASTANISFPEKLKNILVKPEQDYIGFTLAPFIGYRTFGSNLGNSPDFGATILYPLSSSSYLLGSYSYAHSFADNDLNGIHVFDYGFYTVPYTLPQHNLSFFMNAFFSRDSYTDSTHLSIGYGVRMLFKQDVKTVSHIENSVGWSTHTKLGIERSVIIPKNTLSKFSQQVRSSIQAVHLPKMKKASSPKETPKKESSSPKKDTPKK